MGEDKVYHYPQARIVRSVRVKDGGISQTVIGGICVSKGEQDHDGDGDWERIDCEVFIIPRTKFKNVGVENMRIDQVMQTLNEENSWKEKEDD